jgi:hypothetical protein
MADEANNQPSSPLPLNADLMGYPNVESLVAAKRAGDAEAKRLYDENQKKDALLAQVLTNGYVPNGRTVPDRRSESPADRLTQFGVPVDALDEYVGQAIQKAFAPITNGMNARGRIVSDHPDYVQFESDVASFIGNDPELSQRYPKMFEADPVGAMEYAFLKFGDSRRREAHAGNGIVGNPVDASIPSSRAGEGRRAPDGRQELQTAYERFQKSGSSRDAEAYAKLRLHSVIKDDFLNQ